jgi:hypothetical protein
LIAGTTETSGQEQEREYCKVPSHILLAHNVLHDAKNAEHFLASMRLLAFTVLSLYVKFDQFMWIKITFLRNIMSDFSYFFNSSYRLHNYSSVN